MKKLLPLLCFLALSFSTKAQLSSEGQQTVIKYNGYIDSYYASDNDRLSDRTRSSLSALNASKNKFALNTVQISGQVDATDYHAKLTLHYGDISQAAWISTGSDANTPSSRIQEAYAGVRLSDGLWLDGGFFLTHIGVETASPRDNWLSTLSLVTQFEPFFQSGLRLNYDPNSDLHLGLHLLNGYNRFSENNSDKSIGYTISYILSPSSSIALNGIMGNEQPSGSTSLFRTLNNIVFNATLSETFQTRIGIDVATQRASADAATASILGGALVAVRATISPKIALTARGEYYSDHAGILSGSLAFSGIGATLGVEYKPISNAYIRCEARMIDNAHQDAALFENTSGATHGRVEELFSFGLSF